MMFVKAIFSSSLCFKLTSSVSSVLFNVRFDFVNDPLDFAGKYERASSLSIYDIIRVTIFENLHFIPASQKNRFSSECS